MQLDYAPPPKGRRWNARRWLIIIGIVVAIRVVSEWGLPAVTRVRALWVQRQCAAFSYPAGTVIYESDPKAGQALVADSANYAALTDTSIWPTVAVARQEPGCWTSLKGILFPGQSFWPPGPAAPKVLVHRLRNARGAERLVAIILAPEMAPRPGVRSKFDPTGPGLGLVSAVIRPGDWNATPQWEGNGTHFRPGFERAGRVRVFAGVMHPTDPARFSLDYEMDGQRGTIDGLFQDDGDVTFTIRSGPASRPLIR